MNAVATLLLIGTAVVIDNILLSVLLGLAACGSALAAAVQIPSVRRFANRNANPS